jgi:hypothetical protein
VALAVYEFTLDAHTFLAFLLGEFTVFDVHRPETFVGLISSTAGVLPPSVFFAVAIVPLVYIPVRVYQKTEALDLVVLELPPVFLASPSHTQLPLSVLLALLEVTDVDIPVAVVEFSLPMEPVVLELPLVNFALEGEDPPPVLFVIDEIAVVDCTVGLCQFALAVFLASFEIALVVGVLLYVF